MRLSGICGKCKANDWARHVTSCFAVEAQDYEELSMRCCRCFHEVHMTHEAGKPVDGFNIHKPQPDELLW